MSEINENINSANIENNIPDDTIKKRNFITNFILNNINKLDKDIVENSKNMIHSQIDKLDTIIQNPNPPKMFGLDLGDASKTIALAIQPVVPELKKIVNDSAEIVESTMPKVTGMVMDEIPVIAEDFIPGLELVNTLGNTVETGVDTVKDVVEIANNNEEVIQNLQEGVLDLNKNIVDTIGNTIEEGVDKIENAVVVGGKIRRKRKIKRTTKKNKSVKRKKNRKRVFKGGQTPSGAINPTATDPNSVNIVDVGKQSIDEIADVGKQEINKLVDVGKQEINKIIANPLYENMLKNAVTNAAKTASKTLEILKPEIEHSVDKNIELIKNAIPKISEPLGQLPLNLLGIIPGEGSVEEIIRSGLDISTAAAHATNDTLKMVNTQLETAERVQEKLKNQLGGALQRIENTKSHFNRTHTVGINKTKKIRKWMKIRKTQRPKGKRMNRKTIKNRKNKKGMKTRAQRQR